MASEESHIRRSLNEIEEQIGSFKRLLDDPKSAEVLERNTHIAIQAACLAASLKSLRDLSLDLPDCSSCETDPLPPAAAAPPLACQKMASTLRQTVGVLIDTRHSFKSKVLGKLRKNIEELLKEIDDEVLKQG